MKSKMKIVIPIIVIILSMILEKIFPRGKNLWLIIFVVFGIIVILNLIRFYSHKGNENLTSHDDELQLEEKNAELPYDEDYNLYDEDDNPYEEDDNPYDKDYNPYEEDDMYYYQY